VFDKAGVLSPLFWRQGEEIEHSLRIYDAGFTVMHFPHLIVNHEESPINRNLKRHVTLAAANYFKRVLLRNPGWDLPYGLVRCVGFILRNLRSIEVSGVLSELGRADRGLFAVLRSRRPVSRASFRQVQQVRRREAEMRRKHVRPA
jgi:GT2 family glycosyltransferase